jgi:pre-rRNA-processing protein TSR3
MNILVIDYGQDDPAKCTAKKMVQMDLARRVSPKYHASDQVIVMNPYSHRVLSPIDEGTKAILVIDCSWKLARDIFFKKLGGKHRRLPALLAGNPTNYAKLLMLSSLEAVAAALYILGEEKDAERYLTLYKWGQTFRTLNAEPLASYRDAGSEREILALERQFFPQLDEAEA